MDNQFDDIDYEYCDHCDNQDLDIYDEDNVDIYDDDMFDMTDEYDEYDMEDFSSESFVTNMEVEDKFAMDKAINKTKLCDILYINEKAYRPSGKIDRSMFSLHTNDKDIDLTGLWNTFRVLRVKEKSLINLAEYIYFIERKKNLKNKI